MGNETAYPSDPPKEKNFKAHLEWHLFVNGTRPTGPIKLWTKQEFAAALHQERDRTSASQEVEGDARRNLTNWLNGQVCNDRPWGIIIDHVLFGTNSTYRRWQQLFHAARRARPQEDHRAGLYVREQTPFWDRIAATASKNLVEQDWRVDRLDRGVGCTCPAFNARLVVDRPLIRLEQLQGQWTASQHYHRDLVSFILAEIGQRRSGEYSNDAKIRIASDFIKKDTVDIQQTDYLSSLMTDQLGWDQVRSKAVTADLTPEVILRDISSFIDIRTGHLKGFAEAAVSNQLGASTLAFSNDGFLMIVDQNDRNLQSQNLLAPSGSGSLDWGDVADCDAGDLLALVRYGANRELQEECALDPDGHRAAISSDVMVIGFARMLHRAGKPEFFCLGFIGASSAEICQRTPERFVERVGEAGVGRANWRSGRARDEIARICGNYLSKQNVTPLSYPLEHALMILIDLCEDERAGSAIDEFIFRHIQ